MTINPSEIANSDIVHYLRSIFGPKSDLERVEDLNDGIGKRTYLVWSRRPDARCILHVWVNATPDLTEIERDPDLFPHGPKYFAANHEFLADKGIGVPELLLFDDSRTRYGFAFAFVEYIDGPNLSQYKKSTDRAKYAAVLDETRVQMRTLHSTRRSHPGSILTTSPVHMRCEDATLEPILAELDLACRFNSVIRENGNRIRDALKQLRSRIEPRSEFRLIHGELGPDHILVGKDDRVSFIDFEGMSFFDVESEHTMLKARWGSDYAKLKRQDLDPRRMAFYELALQVSWNATASEGAAILPSSNAAWAKFFGGLRDRTTRSILDMVS